MGAADLLVVLATRYLHYRLDEGYLYRDDSHRVKVTTVDCGNICLLSQSKVGDDWHDMASIEVEVYHRDCWDNMARALLIFHGHGRATLDLPPTITATFLRAVETAVPYTVPRHEAGVPDGGLRPGRKQRGTVFGTVHSKNKTVTRKDLENK
jgi:hypothetical protein